MLVRVKMFIYFKTCEDNKLMINYNIVINFISNATSSLVALLLITIPTLLERNTALQ